VRGVNPWEYFGDVLCRIVSHPVNRLRELLPDRWQPLPKDDRGLISQHRWAPLSTHQSLLSNSGNRNALLRGNPIAPHPHNARRVGLTLTKDELIGDFKNTSREWRRKGQPICQKQLGPRIDDT